MDFKKGAAINELQLANHVVLEQLSNQPLIMAAQKVRLLIFLLEKDRRPVSILEVDRHSVSY